MMLCSVVVAATTVIVIIFLLWLCCPGGPLPAEVAGRDHVVHTMCTTRQRNRCHYTSTTNNSLTPTPSLSLIMA